MTGILPFYSKEEKLTLEYCLTGDYLLDGHKIFEDLSSEVKNLITQLLQVEPTNRPSIQKILEHPWFNNSKVFVKPRLNSLDELAY